MVCSGGHRSHEESDGSCERKEDGDDHGHEHVHEHVCREEDFSVHSWPAGGDPEHEEHAQGPGHGAQPGPGVTAFVEADDPAEVDPQTCGAGDSEENVRAPLGEVAQGGGFGGSSAPVRR